MFLRGFFVIGLLVGIGGADASKANARALPDASDRLHSGEHIRRVEQVPAREWQERAEALFDNFFRQHPSFRSRRNKFEIEGSFMDAVNAKGRRVQAFDMRINAASTPEGKERNLGVISIEATSGEQLHLMTSREIVERYGRIFNDNFASIIRNEGKR